MNTVKRFTPTGHARRVSYWLSSSAMVTPTCAELTAKNGALLGTNMSDVPELDRLIEEADTVRQNLYWESRDMFFRRTMGYATLTALMTLPLGVLFGVSGIWLSTVFFCLTIVPFFVISMAELLLSCFMDPPRRDPTKRYKRM